MAGQANFKKIVVSLAAVAALAAPAVWASEAAAKSGPDPDANGDLHSNCHTGSKFRGAGGEDRPKEHGNGESGDCAATPVTPENPPAAPSAAQAGAASSPAVTTAGAAVPVQATPRTTG